MSIWAEVWKRPGDPAFARVIDDIPFREGSLHDTMSDFGDGSLTIPDSFYGFDELLRIAGTNSQTSLVRFRSASGQIVFEWLPSQMVPVGSKDDPFVEVSGRGIKEILGYAVTMPYDWDGTAVQVPNIPNWQWGADNMLSMDGTFEDPPITPKTIQLRIVGATGGTYTLTDETDTTSAIAWDADAATIKTRIETDLGLFNTVLVVAAGPGTFLIEMVDPPFGVNLGINDTGLTPDPDSSGTTQTTVEGGYQAGSWTPARSLVSGAPSSGAYDFWGISDNENHTPGGTFSLQFNGGFVGTTSNRNGGVQHVVNVESGGLYQASVWVFPTNATPDPRIRFAIFTEFEEMIAYNAPNGTLYTENVWTQITLSDIIIPENVDRIIFRVQLTNPAPYNPPPVYVDDAEFYPGLPATTVGEILRNLYESYIDDTLRPTIVWDDGSGTDTPYLTLDFSDTLDSSGATWDDDDVSIEVWMRMTFWDALNELAGLLGIEYRVVPDDPEAGTWVLQVYDEGNMDDAPDVAVMGGADDTRRMLRRFRPATIFIVEGNDGSVAVSAALSLTADLGRIESARLDRMVGEGTGVQRAAVQDGQDAPLAGLVWSYEFTNPVTDQPLSEYRIGDTVMVHDPPEADDEARVWDVTASISPDGVVWDVDFYPGEPA